MSHQPTGEASYVFQGSITRQGAPAEALVGIRYDERDPTTLSIRLDLLGEAHGRDAVSAFMETRREDDLWVYAKFPALQSVHVLGIRSTTEAFGPSGLIDTITIEAREVEVGLTKEAQSDPAQVSVVVNLTPGGILIRPERISFKLDGNVERKVYAEGDISVVLPSGPLHLRSATSVERETGASGESTTRLSERPVLLGEVTIPAGSSLSAVHAQFRGEVADVCSVLGLCYRRRVDFYEIAYHGASVEHARPPATLRRKLLRIPPASRSREELVNFRDLVEGGFEKLLTAFRDHHAKDRLLRTFTLLAASYVVEEIEPAYMLAYAALECTLGAAPKARYELGPGRWERLRRTIITQITKFLEVESTTETERMALIEAVSEKVPELRRLSIRRRVAETCNRLEITTDDLWFYEGFGSGFARATTSRNRLIHAARSEDPEMRSDLVRLQTLTERIVLRLLEWPPEKVWFRSDQTLSWANRGLAPD